MIDFFSFKIFFTPSLKIFCFSSLKSYETSGVEDGPTILIPTAGKSLYFIVLKYAFESSVK